MVTNKSELFGVLDSEDDNIMGEEDDSSIGGFKDNFENLNYDINHIDTKLQNIQGHISTLESKIILIDGYITKNKNNSSVDLGKSFTALNKSYELLSFFQKTHQSYSDLKFKYRTEQNGLKYKLYRMDEIDKKKIDEIEGLDKSDIVSALGKLLDNPSKKTETLKKLDSDPKYKL